jgi:hypothetical protein
LTGVYITPGFLQNFDCLAEVQLIEAQVLNRRLEKFQKLFHGLVVPVVLEPGSLLQNFIVDQHISTGPEVDFKPPLRVGPAFFLNLFYHG